MEAREEIQASRKWLEDNFGVSVGHFSYPLGAFDDRIIGMVREAGYSRPLQPNLESMTRGLMHTGSEEYWHIDR